MFVCAVLAIQTLYDLWYKFVLFVRLIITWWQGNIYLNVLERLIVTGNVKGWVQSMAKARLIKAAKTSLYETAPDQEHEATSTSNVDNEVISTPVEINPSILVPNLENITPTNASHLSFMT